MASLNQFFIRAVDDLGLPLGGCELYFYATGTTTAQDVYADAALTTRLSQPIVSDADGYFPEVFIDDALQYKVIMKKPNGVTIMPRDPINVGASSIPAGSIDATELSAGAVTSSKLATNAVTNAKLADMATLTIKGNKEATTGDPQDLTASEVFTIISGQIPTLVGDSGSGGTKGYAPAPTAGQSAQGRLLTAGGTWGFADLSKQTIGTKNLATNGYVNIGEFQVRFGSVSVGSDSETSVSFNAAFSNACLGAVACHNYSFNVSADAGCAIYNFNATGATVRNGTGASSTISYFAWGY